MEAAIKDGQAVTVLRLISEDAEAVRRPLDAEGNTPVHVAAANGQHACIRALADVGASMDARNVAGKTPIQLAAESAHPFTTATLLTLGVNPAEMANDLGWTPLHLAVWAGDEAQVATLLREATDRAKRDLFGWTPLHVAALAGREALVSELLQAVPASEVIRSVDPSPQHKCVDGDAASAATGRNITAAHNTASVNNGTLNVTTGNAHGATEQLLIDQGADIAAADKTGSTALHHAAWNGHGTAVEVLVDKGLDVSAVNQDGWTVLHHASWNGHGAVVEVLVDKGVDVSAVDKGGWTALHAAAGNGHGAVVEVLVGEGADLVAGDVDRWTALHVAAWNGHGAVVKQLLDMKADGLAVSLCGSSSAFFASQHGHVEALEAIREIDGFTDVPNCIGHSAVHAAAMFDQVDVLRSLLPSATSSEGESRASVDACLSAQPASGRADQTARGSPSVAASTCRFGNTPLHLAAGGGRGGAAKYLLSHSGVDVDAENASRQTPLHLASEFGHAEMVHLLVKHKANVNKRDARGTSALHMAAISQQYEAVTALLKIKAPVSARDLDGYTPLHYAVLAPSSDPPDVVPDAVSIKFRDEVMRVANRLIDNGGRVYVLSALWLSRGTSPLSIAWTRWGYLTAWELLRRRLRFIWTNRFTARGGNNPSEGTSLSQVLVDEGTPPESPEGLPANGSASGSIAG